MVCFVIWTTGVAGAKVLVTGCTPYTIETKPGLPQFSSRSLCSGLYTQVFSEKPDPGSSRFSQTIPNRFHQALQRHNP